MLSSDEWDLLQHLVIILGPFKEATRYLGGEQYITHSIMIPLIEEIKSLLSSNSSTSSTSSTSPVTVFNSPEIFQEIENAVFVIIEEVEIQEDEAIVKKKNNQIQSKIDLNKPFENKDILDEVKKNLYSSVSLLEFYV